MSSLPLPRRFRVQACSLVLSLGVCAAACSSYEGQELHSDGVEPSADGNAQDMPGDGSPTPVDGGGNPGDPSGSGGAPATSDGSGGAEVMGTGGYVWMPPTSDAEFPSEMTDLSLWRLELPLPDTDGEGVLRIEWDTLENYERSPFFDVLDDGSAIRFRAPVESATTTGSGYPRSELREMLGDRTAAWSTSEGRHVMEITQRITNVPPEKPHVVAGQIHDAEDDVVMIRYEGDADNRLFVEAGGDEWAVLDSDYELGEWFTVRIVAEAGMVTVFYNDEQKGQKPTGCLDLEEGASPGAYCYFKAGCYTQSNLAQGDSAGAYGEVEISSLTVTHE